MKKILIFYASYGGGHLSAANSIKQHIDKNFLDYKATLVDCMKYVNKPINLITTKAYKELAKNFPWAWGEVYNHSQKGPIAHISSTTNNILARKLLKLLNEYNPSIVISTHPFGSQMVSYLKRKSLISCKLATILTDFAPHEQWLVGKEQVNYFFVSHEKMKQTLITYNIPENKIFATGIPLSSRFLLHFNKEEIKNDFNLNIDKKTILFFGGGEFGLGKDKTLEIFKSFLNHIDKYQIVAIVGKNEKMKHEFTSLVEDLNIKDSVKVLGFTNMVPELMSISDLVVTKPGGLTSTESLASGLPMIIINPIPGQEEENAKFLENSKVAIWIKKHDDYNKIISNLLNDSQKLKELKLNTKLLAKKNSTKDICNIILNNSI